MYYRKGKRKEQVKEGRNGKETESKGRPPSLSNVCSIGPYSPQCTDPTLMNA